jgi:hypothetical protein
VTSLDLKARLAGLFVDPKREWNAIAAEPQDIGWLYRRFILIVAAVPSIALFLRFTISGAPMVGLGAAVRTYLVTLGTLLVVALVIEKLAPRFRSQGSQVHALKLVAYSSAPAWLAGALYLVPGLGGTALLIGVLYGVYLYALGLPRLLHTPREQIVPFMVVSALILVVINTVINAVLSGLA